MFVLNSIIMKKYLLSGGLLFTSIFGLYAQQLPNPGFEQWDTLVDYTSPSSWHTINPLAAFGFEPSTLISTDAHTGNFSVLLESISSDMLDYTGVLCTGPILNEDLDADFSMMKVPFVYKPTKLRLYYKSMPMQNDKSILGMYLTKWNTNTYQTDTIAYAGMEFPNTITTFTMAELNFVYVNDETPDSMFLIASSSEDGFNPTMGSKLWLDDLELVYSPTGLADNLELSIHTYPNPFNAEITIENPNQNELEIEIINKLGEVVYTQHIQSSKGALNVSQLPLGVYILSCYDVKSKLTSRKKIIKQD